MFLNLCPHRSNARTSGVRRGSGDLKRNSALPRGVHVTTDESYPAFSKPVLLEDL